MKGRIFKTIIVINLIISLAGFNLIFLGNKTILAIYEGLEEQETETNDSNVVFDAYFEEGDTKIHSKQANISEGENLILDINIKNAGIFIDGKIKIENANFKIDKENVKNEMIQSINETTNEIELNQMVSRNTKIILPIKFEKQEANTANYFDQESQVKITGKYKQSDTNIKDIEGQISTRIIWTENPEVNITQEIEKYINLGEEGILLQQKVAIEVENSSLPIEKHTVSIAIPELEGQMPFKIVVLHNGEKLDETQYQIDIENKTLEINQIQDNNNIEWGTGTEEYKMIFNYAKEIGFIQRNINLGTTAIVKLYTKEEVTKIETQELATNSKGNIITLNKEITPEIYKGYMYANVADQISYQEKLNVEFSNTNVVGNNVFSEKTNYVDLQQNKYGTNNSITYQEIRLNKNNMLDILGEEGSIQIQNEEGTVIGNMDKATEADENGNITYRIEDSICHMTIVASKPEKEGQLNLGINKTISGQTGYIKDTLKTFIGLEDITTITNDIEEVTESKTIDLKDTITEAKLEMNPNKLSTLEKNENVQLSVILKSDSPKYDLWKDPYILLQLPKEIEEIKVNSTQLLYGNEIQIERANWIADEKRIELQIKGEQLAFQNNMNEGIQIIINADITLAKTTPSKKGKIELTYQNANRENIEQKAEIDIEMNSKYGVLLYNSLEGYNKENEKIETISQEVAVGKLETQAEEREIKVHTEIVNNYETAINNVSMIGKLPNVNNIDAIKSTINVNLVSSINVLKENVEIYYTTENIDENSDKWTQELSNITEVKAFKIVINELQPRETIPIEYSIKIPRNISENEVAYQVTKLSYEHEGEVAELYSNIKLMTNTKDENSFIDQEINGVKVNVKATTIGKEIQNKDTMQEGQTIRYDIDVTNNTGKDLNNFSMTGVQTDVDGNSNVTFLAMKEEQLPDAYTGEIVTVTNYEEDETLAEMLLQKDKVLAGETVSFQYEFTIHQRKSENEITKGELRIKADGLEETIPLMENPIEEAEVKLLTYYAPNEEVEFGANAENPILYGIENLTDNKLENIPLDIILPEGTTIKEEINTVKDKYSYVSYENNKLRLNIQSLEPNEKIEIAVYIHVNIIEGGKTEQEYTFFCESRINGRAYYSNQIQKIAKQRVAQIDVVQKSNIAEEYVKEGDIITYTTIVKNQSFLDADLTIVDNFVDLLDMQEAYIEKNGQKVKDMEIGETEIRSDYELLANETIQIVIKATVKKNVDKLDKFDHYLIIYDSEQYNTTNKITYKLTDGAGGQDSGNPDDDKKQVGVIAGRAWIDVNKNGIKEETEGIENMGVLLLDAKEGTIVGRTTTDQSGNYRFERLENKNYMVGFQYDINQYQVTKYKVEGINEDKNSDVISKTIIVNGEENTLAITTEIKIHNNSVENMDAGFYQKEIFDLSLQKGIKRIIVQNTKGTRVIEYNDANMAKIELHAKEIAGSNIIIEYSIRVKNEGEIAGYVNDVVDYIPGGLTFSSEINKDWYISTEGNLHNKSLTNEVLKPGETKQLILTLTKTMTVDNTGYIHNTAEIAKSTNDLGEVDQDSTQGNKQENEDDISSADVIISISTGRMTMIIIVLILLELLFVGAILYELKKVTVTKV